MQCIVRITDCRIRDGDLLIGTVTIKVGGCVKSAVSAVRCSGDESGTL